MITMETLLAESSEPLHVKQLQLIATELHKAHEQSDAVSWVPDTIPMFVQQAVKTALGAAAEGEVTTALPLALYVSVPAAQSSR
jgi:hypothetical protein